MAGRVLCPFKSPPIKRGWAVDPLNGKIIGSVTITFNFRVEELAGATTHLFTDTLVYRGNDVKSEEFAIFRPTL